MSMASSSGARRKAPTRSTRFRSTGPTSPSTRSRWRVNATDCTSWAHWRTRTRPPRLTASKSPQSIGRSPQGSYTLNQIQIDRVHLTKHKVEMEGQRYGLHFLGALAYEEVQSVA